MRDCRVELSTQRGRTVGLEASVRRRQRPSPFGDIPLVEVPEDAPETDAFPLVVMLIFAVSNGWLTTCAFMHAPSDVAPTERKRAGTLMVMFLNAGLTCGSLLSFAVKGLTCNCNPFVS